MPPCFPYRFFISALLGLAAGSHGKSELFRNLALEAQGGYVLPLGNLGPALTPAPAAGLRLSSAYYRNFRAQVIVGYARFATEPGRIPVTLGLGAIGLEWRGLPAWLPAPGAGVGMYTARVDDLDDPGGRYAFLHGGESEFGIFPELRWELGLGRPWFLSVSGRWDVILTEPGYSRLFSAYLGIGRKWR